LVDSFSRPETLVFSCLKETFREWTGFARHVKMSNINDKAVLHAIFNPELPVSGEIIENEERYESHVDDEGSSEILDRAKSLELQGVKKAENGDFIGALDDFTKAIQLRPDRPSGYNNRAQALRLNGDTQGAMEDLETAIRLSRDNPSSTKAHGQALCQRGILKRLDGDADGALEDFKGAACMGSPFAKQMVVKMNPYAALCNQMLADVMQKMKDGEA